MSTTILKFAYLFYTAAIITLMMAAVRTSETSVYFHETTRRCIAEGCHLNGRR
jgi:hypothetical protein